MSFGRDTNIGYPKSDRAALEGALAELGTLITSAAANIPDDLGELISRTGLLLEELKRIRRANELILGKDVESEEE